MGCWNKTCGISNLHIYSGSPVYVVVLEKNMDESDRCYTTAFWKPVLLPFTCEYNDYGGGHSSDSNLSAIIDGLKTCLVEMDQGSNKYHDIAVKKDDLNETLFFDAVHEHRLKVKYGNGVVDVDFVMLRKDIVDDILSNWEQQQYVGSGNGNTGYDNAYITYKFQDIVNGIPQFIDRLKEVVNGDPDTNNQTRRLKYMFMELHDVYSRDEKNLVSSYLRPLSNYNYSKIVSPGEIIVNEIERGNCDKASEILLDVLKMTYIESFMNHARKNWAPAGHEGSQSSDTRPYRVLCEATLRAIDAEESNTDWE